MSRRYIVSIVHVCARVCVHSCVSRRQTVPLSSALVVQARCATRVRMAGLMTATLSITVTMRRAPPRKTGSLLSSRAAQTGDKGYVVLRARKDLTQANGLNIQESDLPLLVLNPYFKEEIVEISDS